MSLLSVLKNIPKIISAFSGKKYRNCPDGNVVDKAALKALYAGLINSEQIMAYCDSYTTGLSHGTLTEGLGTYWDINSPEEARTELESLRCYGHRFFYGIVVDIFNEGVKENEEYFILDALIASGRYGDPEVLREEIVAQKNIQIMSDLETTLSKLENLRSVYRQLKDKVNGPYLHEDYTAGILAWDLGRLVTVARMSLDCKYIEQDELNRILAYVDSELHKNFLSWPQFAKSYIIGRACWGGQSMMLDGIINIAEDLMVDETSPWVQSPL